MSKTTVAVIFGGCSSEYEISLLSASSIIRNIPKDKYEIIMLGITKEGHWLLTVMWTKLKMVLGSSILKTVLHFYRRTEAFMEL